MFSMKEKQLIAQKLEELLLALAHPEMPTEKPRFSLHVDGKAEWSYADIKPNWMFDDEYPPTVNPWNELSRQVLPKEKDLPACPTGCGGCSCHIAPPCGHCVEHVAYD